MATIISPTKWWQGVQTETTQQEPATTLPNEAQIARMKLDDLETELRATNGTIVHLESEYARWCQYREDLQDHLVKRLQNVGIKAEVIRKE